MITIIHEFASSNNQTGLSINLKQDDMTESGWYPIYVQAVSTHYGQRIYEFRTRTTNLKTVSSFNLRIDQKNLAEQFMPYYLCIEDNGQQNGNSSTIWLGCTYIRPVITAENEIRQDYILYNLPSYQVELED